MELQRNYNNRRFGCCYTVKVRKMSYLNNSYDVMNCFAKFEKFLPHRIIMPSLMTVSSQMPGVMIANIYVSQEVLSIFFET